MIERELVEQHLLNMEEALARLKAYGDLSLDDLASDLGLQWILEKGLQVLIQNLLDIGAHLLAGAFKNDWDDYSQIIEKLGVHGVIPNSFAENIKGMAGLRNILVHDYLRIDHEKLLEFVRFRLEDFLTFMRFIREYLKAES
jgi:uncharacterized protein YutE (UPF0331/DUF86 family)